MAFVFSAVVAASAFAKSEDNPQWAVCEEVAAGTGAFTNSACTTSGKGNFEAKVLGEKETREVKAEANGSQKLKSATVTIVCKKLKLEAGAILIGSKAPNPGTDRETIVYEECEVEGSPKCTINGEKAGEAKIKTKSLKSVLAFLTKEGAENEREPAVTVFTPESGSQFVEFTLAGECPVTGPIKVEGSVAAENVKSEEHAEKHELNASETAIKEYFVNEGGKTVAKKAELKLEGIVKLPATYIGKAFVRQRGTLIEKIFDWIFHS
jgi:hypothetical protein